MLYSYQNHRNGAYLMETKKYASFWQGAIILTIAGIIVKILSAFYRIPYQNIAGDIGFYIYQQVYPFYGVCLILGTYGFPVVISKLVASRMESGDITKVKDIIYISFLALMCIGILLFCTFFFGAEIIAGYMGDSSLQILLQVIAFSFLLMPFLSVMRGYLQGIGDMKPTAVSQVAEQALRVTIIVGLSLYLVAQGSNRYIVGGGAMFGSVAGSILGIVILAYYLHQRKASIYKASWSAISDKGMIIKLVVLQGILVCISNITLLLIQMVDSVTFYELLLQTGETSERSKVIKAVYDRGFPLIQLGTVVATSFVLPLIPMISAARTKGDYRAVKRYMQLAMKLTLVVALAATGGLICIIEQTNIMLFTDNQGSFTLGILAVCILFGSFGIVASAVLQGIGNTILPAFFAVVGVAIKYMGNIVLMPKLGDVGAAWAAVLSLSCISILNVVYLKHKMKMPLVGWKNASKVVFACLAMMFVLKGYVYGINTLVDHTSRYLISVEALSAVCIGGMLYLILIIRWGVFTIEEVGTVWKGKKLPSFLRSQRL